MKGEFIILINNELKTYTNYDDIPIEFDNLIKFNPSFKEGPHTSEEHDIINNQGKYLQELIKREIK